MKRLMVLLLLIGSVAYGQNGVVVKDTLTLNNGAKFVKGDKVKIGSPTGINNYVFIFSAPTLLVPSSVNMGAAWANRQLLITGFKLEGNDVTGKNYYLILSNGDKRVKIWCDIENALAKGEIVQQ